MGLPPASFARARFAAGQALPEHATFIRNAATVDPLGEPVAADSPRYLYAENPVAVPATVQIVSNLSNTTPESAGFKSDNSSPMMVTVNRWSSISVWDGDPNTGSSQQTSFSDVGGDSPAVYPSIVGGTSGHIYRHASSLVVLGVVYCVCQVYREIESSWTVVRHALIRSTDLGQTWELVFEDPADFGVGKERGQTWTLQSWYSLDRNDNAAGEVLECWIPWVDYFSNADDPQHGKFGLVRQRRATVNDPWVFDDPIILWEFDDAPNHAHSMGVVKWKENGVGVIFNVGDSRPHNAVILGVCDDKDDYDSIGSWSFNESWHGARAPADDASSQAADQFVGVGPWTDPAGVVVGVDEKRDFLQVLTISDELSDRAEPVAVTAWHSFQNPTGSTVLGARVFNIRCERPEVAKEWVAGYSTGGGSSELMGSRVIYFDARSGQNRIAQVWGNRRSQSSWVALLSNGWIYADLASFACRTPTPSLGAAVRPILVGKGGTNKMETGVTVTGLESGATATKLSQGQIDALVADGMPPPPAQGEVWRLTSDGTGRFFASGGGFNLADSAVMSAGDFSFRAWILSLPWSKTSNSASSSPVLSATMVEVGGSTHSTVRRIGFESQNQWFRFDIQDSAGAGAYQPRWDLAITTNVGHSLDVYDLIVCFDTLIEGHPVAGWPLSPDTASAQPDERLTLQAPLPLEGGDTWTALLHGVTPRTGFDATTATDNDPELCRCVIDENNIIIARADLSNSRLIISHITSGAAEATLFTLDELFFVMGSQVHLAINYDGSNINAWASVGCRSIVSGSDSAPGAASAGALESVTLAGDEMAWFGCDIYQGMFLDGPSITGWITGLGLWSDRIAEQPTILSASSLSQGSDTFLAELIPDFNFSGQSTLSIGGDQTDGKQSNAVITWDTDAVTIAKGMPLPTHVELDSADLVLHKTSGSGSVPIVIDKLGESYTASEATWNNRADSTPWTTPGGTPDASASALQASAIIGAETGVKYTVDIKPLYDDAIDNESGILSLLFRPDSTANNAHIGSSRRTPSDERLSLSLQWTKLIDTGVPVITGVELRTGGPTGQFLRVTLDRMARLRVDNIVVSHDGSSSNFRGDIEGVPLITSPLSGDSVTDEARTVWDVGLSEGEDLVQPGADFSGTIGGGDLFAHIFETFDEPNAETTFNTDEGASPDVVALNSAAPRGHRSLATEFMIAEEVF